MIIEIYIPDIHVKQMMYLLTIKAIYNPEYLNTVMSNLLQRYLDEVNVTI